MSLATPRTPTIVERLQAAITDGGGRVVFHINDQPRSLEARELYERARVGARRLVELGVGPGTRVGLVGPNAPEWLEWMYAIWMRGATLVPVPVPLRVRDPAAVSSQLNAHVTGFDCAFIAAHEKFAPLLAHERVIPWTDIEMVHGSVSDGDITLVDDDSLALIMPTSGSTSAPKGVGWAYKGVNRTDAARILNPLGLPAIRHLTYSPLAHAGGFPGHFAPLHPCEVHLLSPERFARDPGELFRLVGKHKILTMTAASSGVAAAVRVIERRPEGVDLSSLEVFHFGAELIDPAVVDRLVDIGGRFGLNPAVVGTRYGLGEGGTTRTPAGAGIRIDEVDLEDLVSHGVARPAAEGRPAKRVASVGSVYGGFEMRIAASDGELPERTLGEVQFRGRGLMSGYIGPGAEHAFDEEGWMHTGDVGYLADDELFLTGRIREVVVRQGRKYHPEDIERAASIGAGVAPDECVAFTAEAGGGDIIVVVETEQTDGLDELEKRVRASILNSVGVVVQSVVFVARATLPKTATGKAQRLAARDKHARGELRVR